MQRLSVVLHGTLGSYLRDALQEGGAAAVACLPAIRAVANSPKFPDRDVRAFTSLTLLCLYFALCLLF
jgi:hypothetical protein